MLVYAHINLLEMLRRFGPNEVVRIATDSIYIYEERSYIRSKMYLPFLSKLSAPSITDFGMISHSPWTRKGRYQ